MLFVRIHNRRGIERILKDGRIRAECPVLSSYIVNENRLKTMLAHVHEP